MSRPTTRNFAETIRARARRAGFRRALLREALDLLLGGEVGVAKIALRDYIHATIGFEALAAQVQINAKSLLRMLGPSGNPQMQHLFTILAHLQHLEGVRARTVLDRVQASTRHRKAS